MREALRDRPSSGSLEAQQTCQLDIITMKAFQNLTLFLVAIAGVSAMSTTEPEALDASSSEVEGGFTYTGFDGVNRFPCLTHTPTLD